MNVPRMDVARYDQMGRSVEFGRADYFIGEFPGANELSQYVNNVRFVPVPGVKIALRILSDRGLILKGYRTSGFFNQQVENWKILCCEPSR